MKSGSVSNEQEKPLKLIKFWRNTVRVVTVNSFGIDQIEIQRFNKKTMKWEKSNYFRTLEDFDSFVDFLDEAGDVLEDAGFVGSPRTVTPSAAG